MFPCLYLGLMVPRSKNDKLKSLLPIISGSQASHTWTLSIFDIRALPGRALWL